MSKSNYHADILKVFKELHTQYPSQNIGRHISMAFADYGDIWGISDKEFLFGLEKYKSELDMNTVPDSDIQKILDDGANFDRLREELRSDNQEEEEEDI